MSNDNIISKVTEFITRDDGTQIRITASNYALPGMRPDVGYFVHRRATNDAPWSLCSNTPAPNAKSMSRADYIRHGRPEVLRYVSWGEILRAMNKIGKPSSQFPEYQ